jgi:hypothetical protein
LVVYKGHLSIEWLIYDRHRLCHRQMNGARHSVESGRRQQRARILVQWRNGSGPLLRTDSVGAIVTRTADWTQRSASLTATAGATHATFVLRMAIETDNSGQTWFDDLSFGS